MYIKKRFLYMLVVVLKTNSVRYERYYSEKNPFIKTYTNSSSLSYLGFIGCWISRSIFSSLHVLATDQENLYY